MHFYVLVAIEVVAKVVCIGLVVIIIIENYQLYRTTLITFIIFKKGFGLTIERVIHFGFMKKMFIRLKQIEKNSVTSGAAFF